MGGPARTLSTEAKAMLRLEVAMLVRSEWEVIFITYVFAIRF